MRVGIAAGLLGGAIIGGAIASSRPAYAAPAPVYVDDYPACRLVRERFWDGYGWRHRRVEGPPTDLTGASDTVKSIKTRPMRPGFSVETAIASGPGMTAGFRAHAPR